MLVNFDVTVSYLELSQWQLFGNSVCSQSVFVQDIFKIILQLQKNWISGLLVQLKGMQSECAQSVELWMLEINKWSKVSVLLG